MRGSRKSNSCEKWLSTRLKNYGNIVSASTIPLEGRMLAQIFFGQHFLCSFRLTVKFLPAADPLLENAARGPPTLFPGQP